MASYWGFGTNPEIALKIDDIANRPTTQAWIDDQWQTLPIFSSDEAISGQVFLTIPKGKKIEHRGVRIDLIGFIEFASDKGQRREITTLTLDKEGAGELSESQTYDFKFIVPKRDETYYGSAVTLRYVIRAKIRRAYGAGVECSKDFSVQNISPAPTHNERIKMEVGIEDCLHIEFEYQRNRYALTDVVLGKIYFLRVKIKVKHMELVLIRRESSGGGNAAYNENETLGKYEIMQGAPVRGEVIPVRLFLAPFPLTPTYRSIHNTFSVRYYLNLVLIDEEDRRYFKQQEIILWRDRIGSPDSLVQYSGASEEQQFALKQQQQQQGQNKVTQQSTKEPNAKADNKNSKKQASESEDQSDDKFEPSEDNNSD